MVDRPKPLQDHLPSPTYILRLAQAIIDSSREHAMYVSLLASGIEENIEKQDISKWFNQLRLAATDHHNLMMVSSRVLSSDAQCRVLVNTMLYQTKISLLYDALSDLGRVPLHNEEGLPDLLINIRGNFERIKQYATEYTKKLTQTDDQLTRRVKEDSLGFRDDLRLDTLQRITEAVFRLTQVLPDYVCEHLQKHFGDHSWWQAGVVEPLEKVRRNRRLKVVPRAGSRLELVLSLDARICLELIYVHRNSAFAEYGRKFKEDVDVLRALLNKYSHFRKWNSGLLVHELFDRMTSVSSVINQDAARAIKQISTYAMENNDIEEVVKVLQS